MGSRGRARCESGSVLHGAYLYPQAEDADSPNEGSEPDEGSQSDSESNSQSNSQSESDSDQDSDSEPETQSTKPKPEWTTAKRKKDIGKRSSKHAPTEVTSKRPVSRHRQVVDVPVIVRSFYCSLFE